MFRLYVNHNTRNQVDKQEVISDVSVAVLTKTVSPITTFSLEGEQNVDKTMGIAASSPFNAVGGRVFGYNLAAYHSILGKTSCRCRDLLRFLKNRDLLVPESGISFVGTSFSSTVSFHLFLLAETFQLRQFCLLR